MSTHEEILATWLEEHGDLEMVLFKHKLSPAQLRDFVADPLVIATMDAHESLLARRRRILASMHMQNAAEMLSKSMFESSSLIECRRAATSLARLTRDMTRNSSPAPGGGGGRAREAGGGAFDPKETAAQAVAPLPLPVALNGERCPKGGEGSSLDPQITTPAPTTHKTRDLPSHIPKETTAQAVAPLPLPVAHSAERCPKGGEGSSIAPHPTTPGPPPPREPGRVAPPSPLPVALDAESCGHRRDRSSSHHKTQSTREPNHSQADDG
jgi:hypothetical protein